MITYTDQISVEEYNELRQSVNWIRVKEKRAQKALDHSFYKLVARKTDVPADFVQGTSTGEKADVPVDPVQRTSDNERTDASVDSVQGTSSDEVSGTQAGTTLGKPIGMARIVSDGGYTYFITDVIVRPECQGEHIGTTLIEKLLEFIKKDVMADETVMVSLMAAYERESFYERFGFHTRPFGNHGPGMSMWVSRIADGSTITS